MANGYEHGVHRNVLLLAGLSVLHHQRVHGLVALDLHDLRVGQELDLRVVAGALLHDLGRTELVTTVNDGDGLAELREEVGLLHRGIAAADHRDLLVLEEEAIAGRTGGHAAAQHLLFTGNVQVARGCTGSQDYGPRLVLLAVGPHLLDLAGQVDLLHVLLT